MQVTRIENWTPFQCIYALIEGNLLSGWVKKVQGRWRVRDWGEVLRLYGQYRTAISITARQAELWGIDSTPFVAWLKIDTYPKNPDFHKRAKEVYVTILACRAKAIARFEILRQENANPSAKTSAILVGPIGIKKIDRALVELKNHPDWTNRRIAALVKLNPATLSRNKHFKAARSAFRQRPRLGYRDIKTGNIDGIDE